MSDFNRGLEQGIELGKLKERERIIELLEDLDRHGTTHSEFCAARHAYAAQAIALIKGEK